MRRALLISAGLILLAGCGASGSSPPAASETVDPTMGPRTRAFVTTLRDCQTGVRLLRGIIAQVSDPVALATAAHQAKSICDGVRSHMIDLDTNHFDSEALDAEVAVDYYKDGIDDVSDYIDTQTPSDIPSALDHFANANSAAAQAIQEINERRQVYGFGNI